MLRIANDNFHIAISTILWYNNFEKFNGRKQMENITLFKWEYPGYYVPMRFGVRFSYNHPKKIFPIHTHDYYEIEYVVSGKLEHEIHGSKYIIECGDFYGIAPGDIHRFNVLEDSWIYSICIEYKKVAKNIQQMLDSVSFPIKGKIEGETAEEFSFLHKRMQKILAGGEDEYTYNRTLANTILTLCLLFENASPIDENSKKAKNKYILKSFKYISEHFSENIGVSDIAENIGISPNHLSAVFTKIVGDNITNYLNEYRISCAATELKQTETPITAIALNCGFSSFCTFSRNFKKVYGITPSEYREKNKQ